MSRRTRACTTSPPAVVLSGPRVGWDVSGECSLAPSLHKGWGGTRALRTAAGEGDVCAERAGGTSQLPGRPTLRWNWHPTPSRDGFLRAIIVAPMPGPEQNNRSVAPQRCLRCLAALFFEFGHITFPADEPTRHGARRGPWSSITDPRIYRTVPVRASYDARSHLHSALPPTPPSPLASELTGLQSLQARLSGVLAGGRA